MDQNWQPKKRTIVLIWAVVLVAAGVLAFLLQDDDPYTDESAGAGALAFVVGTAATGVYAAVGSYRHSRRGRRR
jgi:tryptophan-rich sensory protein